MQARFGEREKKVINLGVKLFLVKMGKRTSKENMDAFFSSIYSNGNCEALQKIITTLNKAVEKTKPRYQRNIMEIYGYLGLWILLNHPKFTKFTLAVLSDITGIDVKNCEVKSELTKFELILINKIIPYVYKKLLEQGTRLHHIIIDMDSCTNVPCRYLLFDIIEKNIKLIEDKMFQEIAMALSATFLWVMIRDTAYRDPFFWSLYEIANIKIKKLIRKSPHKLVKPFDLWYGNVWYDGTIDTKKRRATGELGFKEFDEKEQACVPGIQKRWKKELMN